MERCEADDVLHICHMLEVQRGFGLNAGDLRCSTSEFSDCPWGHPGVYRSGPTEADELRRERNRLKQQLAEKDDEIRAQREHREAAERRTSAARGQITKLKNATAGGLCPCCGMSFVQLRSHMKSKHPEFQTTEDAPEEVTA